MSASGESFDACRPVEGQRTATSELKQQISQMVEISVKIKATVLVSICLCERSSSLPLQLPQQAASQPVHTKRHLFQPL